MRHEKDLRPAGLRDTRVTRLFELHRQDAVQTGSGRAYGGPDTLRPDIELRLRERAMRSLRTDQVSEPSDPR